MSRFFSCRNFQVITLIVFSQCFKFPDRPSYFEYKEVLKRFLTTRYSCADYSGAIKKGVPPPEHPWLGFILWCMGVTRWGFSLSVSAPTHSTNSPPHLSFLILFLNEEKGPRWISRHFAYAWQKGIVAVVWSLAASAATAAGGRGTLQHIAGTTNMNTMYAASDPRSQHNNVESSGPLSSCHESFCRIEVTFKIGMKTFCVWQC